MSQLVVAVAVMAAVMVVETGATAPLRTTTLVKELQRILAKTVSPIYFTDE